MLRIRSQQMRLAARGLQLWRVPGLATGWLRRRITGGGGHDRFFSQQPGGRIRVDHRARSLLLVCPEAHSVLVGDTRPMLRRDADAPRPHQGSVLAAYAACSRFSACGSRHPLICSLFSL